MKLPFFHRKPDYKAATYARAQELLEGGMELEAVLRRFASDSDWLRPMLAVASGVRERYTADEPSFYFEASLKAKFLAAFNEAPAARVAPVPAAPVPVFMRMRTGVASAAFVSFAAVMGVLTFGFVTADQAVPGDWNYTFKLANERIQYTLARGDDRVNVQLQQTEARVYEIQQLAKSGDLSQSDIDKLGRTWRDLQETAQKQPLDTLQRARLSGAQQSTVAVLGEAVAKKTELQPAATNAIETTNAAAAAAGLGTGQKELPPPAASPTPSPSPSATASTEPTARPSAPAPSETPKP